MLLIPRSALLVSQKKACLNWRQNLKNDASRLPIQNIGPHDGSTVYLIPGFNTIDEHLAWLKKNYKPILENVLTLYCAQPEYWPKLSWKTFDDFFEFSIQTIVTDALFSEEDLMDIEIPGKNRKNKNKSTAKAPRGEALILDIVLEHIKPKIWRRVIVPADITFFELHYVIQFSMEWSNSHLFHFIAGKNEEFIGMLELDGFIDYTDAKTTKVSDYLKKPKDKLDYEYDFGDGWTHTITLREQVLALEGQKLPWVLDGARACPPEDCGGVPGYMHLCATLQKPHSKAAKEIKEWIGYPYDPEAFDLEDVNINFEDFESDMEDAEDWMFM